MAVFTTFNSTGGVVETKEKSFNHIRSYTMRCRQEQLFLTRMYKDGVVRGTIKHDYSETVLKFEFDRNGKAQFLFTESFGK